MEVTDDLDKASCGGEMTGMGQREWRREIGDSEKKFCFAEVFCKEEKIGKAAREEWSQKSFCFCVLFVF